MSETVHADPAKTQARREVYHAEERLLKAALRCLLAERGLADPDGDARTLANTSDGLRIAAKDVYEAVEALPMGDRPKGWGT